MTCPISLLALVSHNLLLKRAMRTKYSAEPSRAQPGFGVEIVPQIGLPEGQRALQDQCLENRIVLAAPALALLACKDHMITALQHQEILICRLDVIERYATVCSAGITDRT